MSMENIKEYARRCVSEPELREVAKNIALTDIDGHMRHAETLGLGFSNDDLEALRQEITGSEELEDLSLEELEDIAGGAVTTTAAVAVGVGVGAAAGGVVAGAAAGGSAAAVTSSAW